MTRAPNRERRPTVPASMKTRTDRRSISVSPGSLTDPRPDRMADAPRPGPARDDRSHPRRNSAPGRLRLRRGLQPRLQASPRPLPRIVPSPVSILDRLNHRVITTTANSESSSPTSTGSRPQVTLRSTRGQVGSIQSNSDGSLATITGQDRRSSSTAEFHPRYVETLDNTRRTTASHFPASAKAPTRPTHRNRQAVQLTPCRQPTGSVPFTLSSLTASDHVLPSNQRH